MNLRIGVLTGVLSSRGLTLSLTNAAIEDHHGGTGPLQNLLWTSGLRKVPCLTEEWHLWKAWEL